LERAADPLRSPPLAERPARRYVRGMLGRALFALVILIIAAGVVLPMYPSELVGLDLARSDGNWQVAGSAPFECPADAPQSCGLVLSAGGAPQTVVTITVHFTVEPAAGRPDLPKLPAI
jgi:hypothetical protein